MLDKLPLWWHWLGLTEKRNSDDDPVNNEAMEETKANFEDFLTCLATHTPHNFFQMVMQKSTSFNLIFNKIYETFNLKTKGEHFLCGVDIQIECGEDASMYWQGWMQFKDFYTVTLLKVNDVWQGAAMPENERLSPLATNFIIKEWLNSIDSRLPPTSLEQRVACLLLRN